MTQQHRRSFRYVAVGISAVIQLVLCLGFLLITRIVTIYYRSIVGAIWAFGFIAGIIGAVAGFKQNKNLVIAYMVMAIIFAALLLATTIADTWKSTIFAAILLPATIVGASLSCAAVCACCGAKRTEQPPISKLVIPPMQYVQQCPPRSRNRC